MGGVKFRLISMQLIACNEGSEKAFTYTENTSYILKILINISKEQMVKMSIYKVKTKQNCMDMYKNVLQDWKHEQQCIYNNALIEVKGA